MEESDLACPHCGEQVNDLHDSVKGCQDCIDKWLDEMHIDHHV